jgi:stage III sporulation protein AB
MKMSSRLREKQLALAKLNEILLQLENEICGLGVPLHKAFEKLSLMASNGAWTTLFHALTKNMNEKGTDAGMAWKQALEEAACGLPFDPGELGLLKDFGDMLGKSDRDMQLAILRMEKEKVMAMENRAKETLATSGKMYRNLGALFGAAAVILLI